MNIKVKLEPKPSNLQDAQILREMEELAKIIKEPEVKEKELEEYLFGKVKELDEFIAES